MIIEYEKTLDTIMKLTMRMNTSFFNQTPPLSRVLPPIKSRFLGELHANHRKYHAATPVLNKYNMKTDRYDLLEGFVTLMIGNRAAQFCEASATIPGGEGISDHQQS